MRGKKEAKLKPTILQCAWEIGFLEGMRVARDQFKKAIYEIEHFDLFDICFVPSERELTLKNCSIEDRDKWRAKAKPADQPRPWREFHHKGDKKTKEQP